jgi:uncharacterized membrane protein YphA (DoxX/SURF4 family)
MARLATVTAVLFLLLTAAAGAHDGGQGWFGETNDKAVTNGGFILIAFFPLFILLASLLQWQLDKRKERRKAAAAAREQRAEWRGGW